MNLVWTALAPLLWGTSYLVTTEYLPPHRPLFSAVVRMLPAGLLFVAAGRWVPDGRWLLKLVVLGLLNFGVFFVLLFWAAYRVAGGVGATIGGIGPLLFAALAWPLLGQKPRRLTLAAGFVGCLGVALLVWGPGAQVDPAGALAVVVAVFCMALGGVLAKRWGRPASLWGYVGWQMLTASVVVGAVCLPWEGIPTLTWTNVWAFGYLGFLGTGLAYALWFRGIEKVGVSVSFLALLSPLVAAGLGYLVLGQGLSLAQTLGAVVILGSLVAGQVGGRPRRG